MKAVENWRKESSFWTKWNVVKDVGDLKNDFSEGVVARELKKAPALELLAQGVQTEISSVQALKNAKKTK